MSFQFKPATREDVNLLIGLAGGTGSGKTYSAMELATGLAAGARFAVIDTEAGRAKHYADDFQFDSADLAPPFSPGAYSEAIAAADAAGYPVIVVDSMSHEHAGDGGLLDMHDVEFQRMGGKDSSKMAAWVKPKGEHKKMVSKLLQLRAHLILCFRAEQKIEMVKVDGKWQIVPKRSLTGLDGWIPISEKNLPFELTVSFLLTADAPGIPKPIKLPDRLKPFFPLDRPIGLDAGKELAAWAAGGKAPKRAAKPKPEAAANGTGDLVAELTDLCVKLEVDASEAIEAHATDREWLIKQIGTAKHNLAIKQEEAEQESIFAQKAAEAQRARVEA